MEMRSIAEFITERDAVLMAPFDVERVRAFYTKYDPDAIPETDYMVESGYHRARTALRSIPIESRLASKRWLTERGLTSLDDGELTQEQAWN